jgi:hypothetical protein
MEIIQYFEREDEDRGCCVLRLKKKERESFLSKLPSTYRNCYITDKKVEELFLRLKQTKTAKEIIESTLPDKGNIMSGEFGEITTYYILKEEYRPLKLLGPKKWRWKVDRNKPIQYSDVILFYRNKKPSADDLLVVAETKAKATASKDNPILDAINGIKKDHISRLAKTLVWLKERYTVTEPNSDKIKFIERFINSQQEEYGQYTKHFKAVAVIDASFLDNELSEEIDKPPQIGHDLEIIVISINSLKQAYETTYAQMKES